MSKVTIFGDFKVNNVKHLNLSAELVYLLNTSDVKLVNFEAPIHSNGNPIKKSGPNICQHVEAPEWLEERGFNAISLANNHTMDYGEAGLESSVNAFKKAEILGVGTWKDAYRMHVFTTSDGLKVGIISCTHCEFGTLTDENCANSKGCAWSLSTEIIRAIRGWGGGYLIVFNHGGVEYMDVPLPEWRDVYRLWIEMGADAVIASHPHVPQGYELYKGKPICYSLGNFCFDPLGEKVPEHWFESLCCVLDIDAPHHANLDVRRIVYDFQNGYIKDNNSEMFEKHMLHLCELLKDEKKYTEEVNRSVAKLLPQYKGQFSRGGFITGLIQKGLLKGLVEGFMGRGFFNRTHALNNMQCESHRWAILRAMKNIKE